MHASISRFPGDPDDLARRYDAMLAEVPHEGMLLHLCLRTPDGLVVVDTCPTRSDFEAFHGGEPFRACWPGAGCPSPSGWRTSRSTSPSPSAP
jgi:hypothetical protein